MTVTLRQRQKGKNNKLSLYLDFYDRGKRKREYLGLYLINNPTTKEQRLENKNTLGLAEKIRAKRILAFQSKSFDFENPDEEEVSFLKYFEKLAERRSNSLSNYGNWISTLKHLEAYVKNDISIQNIDAIWLENFKDYLKYKAKTKAGLPLSQNTLLSYYSKVVACFKEAHRKGLILKNPAIQVSNFKEEEVKREFLSLEEVKKLIATPCRNEVLKRAFIFSCYTGIRFKDIKSLKWNQIAYSEEMGWFVRFKQQKTGGQETLPFSEEVVDLIGDKQNEEEYVFPFLAYNNNLLREWINKAEIKKHITFHCARHTYATLLLTMDTDIYTVSKMLGHKDLKTTQVYAKVVNQKKQEAASKLKFK